MQRDSVRIIAVILTSCFILNPPVASAFSDGIPSLSPSQVFSEKSFIDQAVVPELDAGFTRPHNYQAVVLRHAAPIALGLSGAALTYWLSPHWTPVFTALTGILATLWIHNGSHPGPMRMQSDDWVPAMNEGIHDLETRLGVKLGEDIGAAFQKADAVIETKTGMPFELDQEIWHWRRLNLLLMGEFFQALAATDIDRGPMFRVQNADKKNSEETLYFRSSQGLMKANLKIRLEQESPILYLQLELLEFCPHVFDEFRIGCDRIEDLVHSWPHMDIGPKSLSPAQWIDYWATHIPVTPFPMLTLDPPTIHEAKAWQELPVTIRPDFNQSIKRLNDHVQKLLPISEEEMILQAQKPFGKYSPSINFPVENESNPNDTRISGRIGPSRPFLRQAKPALITSRKKARRVRLLPAVHPWATWQKFFRSLGGVSKAFFAAGAVVLIVMAVMGSLWNGVLEPILNSDVQITLDLPIHTAFSQQDSNTAKPTSLDLGINSVVAHNTRGLAEYQKDMVTEQMRLYSDYVTDNDPMPHVLGISPAIFHRVIDGYKTDEAEMYEPVMVSLSPILNSEDYEMLKGGKSSAESLLKRINVTLNGWWVGALAQYTQGLAAALDRAEKKADGSAQSKLERSQLMISLQKARGIQRSPFAEAAVGLKWIYKNPERYVSLKVLEDRLYALSAHAGYSDSEMETLFYPYFVGQLDLMTEMGIQSELYRRQMGNTSEDIANIFDALKLSNELISDIRERTMAWSRLPGRIRRQKARDLALRFLVRKDRTKAMEPGRIVLDLGLAEMRRRGLVMMGSDGRYSFTETLKEMFNRSRYRKTPAVIRLSPPALSQPNRSAYWKPEMRWYSDDAANRFRADFSREIKSWENDVIAGREPMLASLTEEALRHATQGLSGYDGRSGISPAFNVTFMSITGIGFTPDLGVFFYSGRKHQLVSKSIAFDANLVGAAVKKIGDLKREGELRRALTLQTVYRMILLGAAVDFNEIENRLPSFELEDANASKLSEFYTKPGFPSNAMSTVLRPGMSFLAQAHFASWAAQKKYAIERRMTVPDLVQAGKDMGGVPVYARYLSGIGRLISQPTMNPDELRLTMVINMIDPQMLKDQRSGDSKRLAYPLQTAMAIAFLRAHLEAGNIKVENDQIFPVQGREQFIYRDLRPLEHLPIRDPKPSGMAPGTDAARHYNENRDKEEQMQHALFVMAPRNEQKLYFESFVKALKASAVTLGKELLAEHGLNSLDLKVQKSEIDTSLKDFDAAHNDPKRAGEDVLVNGEWQPRNDVAMRHLTRLYSLITESMLYVFYDTLTALMKISPTKPLTAEMVELAAKAARETGITIHEWWNRIYYRNSEGIPVGVASISSYSGIYLGPYGVLLAEIPFKKGWSQKSLGNALCRTA